MCTFGYIRVFHIDDFGRMLIGCIFHFFVLQSFSCVRSTTDLLRSSGKIPFTGCPLYFDTLNSWHSWHFTDILNPKFLTYGTKNITQRIIYNGSCGSCVSEACNSYHFYIFRVAQSEKIMVHNTNGVNQKDILLKPFLHVMA